MQRRKLTEAEIYRAHQLIGLMDKKIRRLLATETELESYVAQGNTAQRGELKRLQDLCSHGEVSFGSDDVGIKTCPDCCGCVFSPIGGPNALLAV